MKERKCSYSKYDNPLLHLYYKKYFKYFLGHANTFEVDKNKWRSIYTWEGGGEGSSKNCCIFQLRRLHAISGSFSLLFRQKRTLQTHWGGGGGHKPWYLSKNQVQRTIIKPFIGYKFR